MATVGLLSSSTASSTTVLQAVLLNVARPRVKEDTCTHCGIHSQIVILQNCVQFAFLTWLISSKYQRLNYSCEVACNIYYWILLGAVAVFIQMGWNYPNGCDLYYWHYQIPVYTVFPSLEASYPCFHCLKKVLIYNQAGFCRHDGFAIQYLGNVIFY